MTTRYLKPESFETSKAQLTTLEGKSMNDHVPLPFSYVQFVVNNWESGGITADEALGLLLMAQDQIREEENADKH